MTIVVTGVDTIAGAKLVKDTADLVGIGATTVSGDVTKLAIHIELTDAFVNAPDQTAKLELHKTTDTTDTPFQTTQAFALPKTPSPTPAPGSTPKAGAAGGGHK